MRVTRLREAGLLRRRVPALHLVAPVGLVAAWLRAGAGLLNRSGLRGEATLRDESVLGCGVAARAGAAVAGAAREPRGPCRALSARQGLPREARRRLARIPGGELLSGVATRLLRGKAAARWLVAACGAAGPGRPLDTITRD